MKIEVPSGLEDALEDPLGGHVTRGVGRGEPALAEPVRIGTEAE